MSLRFIGGYITAVRLSGLAGHSQCCGF